MNSIYFAFNNKHTFYRKFALTEINFFKTKLIYFSEKYFILPELQKYLLRNFVF